MEVDHKTHGCSYVTTNWSSVDAVHKNGEQHKFCFPRCLAAAAVQKFRRYAQGHVQPVDKVRTKLQIGDARGAGAWCMTCSSTKAPKGFRSSEQKSRVAGSSEALQ